MQQFDDARRPAVVVSPAAYNRKVGLALFCPVTGQEKGYPFEVRLPSGLSVGGVVLSDHVKNLDWRARPAVSPTRWSAKSWASWER